MSLLYSDLPVYVGPPNSDAPGETSRYVTATEVNVSLNASAGPKRNLGKSIDTDDQFKFQGPINANISFTAILDPVFNGGFEFANEDHIDDYFAVKIGKNFYKKCYLNNFSVSISPFAPVTFRADFISLHPVSGEKILRDPSPYAGTPIPFDSDDVIYGYTCSVTNMDDVVGNVQSQINYTKEFKRTPVYTLGSTLTDTMLLDGVESKMQITSTGLQNLISISGDKLASDVVVELDNIDGDSITQFPSLTMSAGARVLTENYSVNGGETVLATAEIRQIDL